jgi:hypothetical protein
LVEALPRISFGHDEFMNCAFVALAHAVIVAVLLNCALNALRSKEHSKNGMWPRRIVSLIRSIGLLFGDVGRVVFVEEEDVDDDEGGADSDGGIGDVEGGPVVAAEPHFEEVGDCAVDDPVGDVARGTTEQKREAGSGEGTAAVTCDKQPSERADDCGGSDDQQDAHGRRGRIGKDAEGDSRIAAVHQVDEIVDQLAVPAFDGLRFEPSFAGAVEENDG